MLDSFRALDQRIFSGLGKSVDWVFLEVHAEGEWSCMCDIMCDIMCVAVVVCCGSAPLMLQPGTRDAAVILQAPPGCMLQDRYMSRRAVLTAQG